MAKNDFHRRMRLYIMLVCQRICAHAINQRKIDRIVEHAFRQIIENWHLFIDSDSESSGKLSPRICRWLEWYLCCSMSELLDEQALFDLIKNQNESSLAKHAADNAKELVYGRHHKDLLKCSLWFKNRLNSNSISDADIEEVVQDVFMNAFKKAHQFKAAKKNIGKPERLKSQALAWLSQSARNRICDILRENNRQPEVRIGDIRSKSEEGDDVSDEEWLSVISGTRAQINQGIKGVEDSMYSSSEPPPTDSQLKDNELLKKFAYKAFSGKNRERDLEIYLATLENYFDEEEKNKVMQGLKKKWDVSDNYMCKIIPRSRGKIWKYVESAAHSVLSGIAPNVLLTMIKQYSDNKQKEDLMRELKNNLGISRVSIELVFQDSCKRIKKYMES